MGILLFSLIIMPFIVAIIAASKGRSGFGFFIYALLIWPIALVHILVSASSAKGALKREKKEGRIECRYCAEFIRPGAKICPHCRSDLTDDHGDLEGHDYGMRELSEPRPPLSEASSGEDIEYADNSEDENQSARHPPLQAGKTKPPPRYGFLALLLLLSALLGAFIWSGLSDDDRSGRIGEVASSQILADQTSSPRNTPASTESARRATPPSSRAETDERSETESYSQVIAALQGYLDQLGYEVGAADGIFGPRTRTAIEEYERAKGLPVTGQATEELLERLSLEFKDRTVVVQSRPTVRTSSPDCENRGRVALAAIVICPPGLSDRDLELAGQTACPGSRLCNAWIWDDPTRAPRRPPDFANPMTDAQVNSAVAVWVSRTHTLNICARNGC